MLLGSLIIYFAHFCFMTLEQICASDLGVCRTVVLLYVYTEQLICGVYSPVQDREWPVLRSRSNRQHIVVI